VPVYFRLVEVVLLAVLGSELCAVTGNKFTPDQVKMFCNFYCCPEDLLMALGLSLLKLEIVL